MPLGGSGERDDHTLKNVSDAEALGTVPGIIGTASSTVTFSILSWHTFIMRWLFLAPEFIDGIVRFVFIHRLPYPNAVISGALATERSEEKQELCLMERDEE